MPLRIACDLDGTIADMDAALQREAQRLFGPDVDLRAARPLESVADVEEAIGDGQPAAGRAESAASPGPRPPSRAQVSELWSHVARTADFWQSLGEIEPGAVARLAALAMTHRWEVLFLTQRPPTAGETTQLQSQRWLRAHGFEFPSVFVMDGSRGRVAHALSLDVVIDDRPSNCLDVVADSSALPMLVWRQPSVKVPLGVNHTRTEILPSVSAALNRLVALTGDRTKSKTLLGRVKSAFGL
jgi:hypothetical protein